MKEYNADVTVERIMIYGLRENNYIRLENIPEAEKLIEVLRHAILELAGKRFNEYMEYVGDDKNT